MELYTDCGEAYLTLKFVPRVSNTMSQKKVITEQQKVIYDNSTQSLGSDGSIISRNRNLDGLESDVLYHLAMSTDTHDFPALFGDVKFVCMGGTLARMKSFAQYMAQQLNIEFKDEDLTLASHRYAMFKVGPILSVTHGMGISSLSILMHELIKLVYYAKCKNVVFLRIGTSGGIGVEQGTVVVSDKAVDGLLRPYYELYILGEIVRRPALFDRELVEEIKLIAKEISEFPTVSGATMCAFDFYEAQGRLDGAFCDITAEQKMQFLSRMKNEGVVNIEMEAITFASMCYYAGIKCAIICVTLLNRLECDQVSSSKKHLEELQTRPMILAAKFIMKRLSQYNQEQI